MRIEVNGDSRELEAGLTLRALLASLEMTKGRLAVEINGEIVPRGEYESHCLRDGDRVEIVHAIGGG